MEARGALERAGWQYVRTGSSRHMVLRREGMPVALSIPDHRTLDRGLLRSLIRDAGMTVEEFTENL
ncbi:MAG: type II toxin-antitoxin system HicA family toxin [Candidatus Sumerlaeota bacterium]|nr:type II toxin-antitoxin system HicA family toxin [Candidatus Sumerlaeota bacterium]